MSVKIDPLSGDRVMVCDCDRAGADMEAFDLPIIPLLCDGKCGDETKIKRYSDYLESGGRPWERGAAPI